MPVISRIPSLLHEPVGTNLIDTEDLRKFIGWTEVGGASVTVTQGQTISPAGSAPGSVPGEATRIESSGGDAVAKYQYSLSAPTGSRAVRVLVHNQGDNTATVRLREAAADSVVTAVPVGETVEVRLTLTFTGTGSLRVEFVSTSAGDDLDILAWGPMLETGVVASTFPGISGTTRPTDQLTQERQWSLADIEDGATWWLDVVNEGIFADTGATRRIYMNNDGVAGAPDDGLLADIAADNTLRMRARDGGGTAAFASVSPATVNTWAIGDRLRLALRLITDSGQHRLRIDYKLNDGSVVTGTASSLFDLPTTLSGTKESFFSRGNGVDGVHVAALAGGIVQHTDGVPTFAAIEEEFA